jgi:hypothetical protein
MAKRSNVPSNNRAELGEVEVEERKLEKEAVFEPELVLIRNLHPANVIVAGAVTGTKYVFNGAGAEVKVDRRDMSEMLGKLRGGCCGGSKSRMFELVKEEGVMWR